MVPGVYRIMLRYGDENDCSCGTGLDFKRFRIKFTTPVKSRQGNLSELEMRVTTQAAGGQEPKETSL
jgi:hypothetical protein